MQQYMLQELIKLTQQKSPDLYSDLVKQYHDTAGQTHLIF
jgi:hypothetical protein